MLKRLSRLAGSPGFTLMELLIVIVIIAVLAIAVLAALNPIEQINRSRDTANRSDAAQMSNAIDRYYAVQEEYPWVTDDPTTYTTGDEELALFDVGGSGSSSWVAQLSTTNEVKDAYVARVTGAGSQKGLYAYKAASADVTYVCFDPQSDAFKDEAVEGCTAMAGDSAYETAANCVSGATTWTVQRICLP